MDGTVQPILSILEISPYLLTSLSLSLPPPTFIWHVHPSLSLSLPPSLPPSLDFYLMHVLCTYFQNVFFLFLTPYFRIIKLIWRTLILIDTLCSTLKIPKRSAHFIWHSHTHFVMHLHQTIINNKSLDSPSHKTHTHTITHTPKHTHIWAHTHNTIQTYYQTGTHTHIDRHMDRQKHT